MGNYEVQGKKTVMRVTITECKKPTDGITFDKELITLCFVHAGLIVPATCVFHGVMSDCKIG